MLMILGGWMGLLWILAAVVLCGVWVVVKRLQVLLEERWCDQRVRAELEAYARLEVEVAEDGDARERARRVCRVVAEVSVFHRVAMMVSDAEGRLIVEASAGMDEATVEALNGWGVGTARVRPEWRKEEGERDWLRGRERRGAGARSGLGVKAGTRSFLLGIGGMVWVAPLWTTAGRMCGALVVGGDGEAEDVVPLESLAEKLARTMENAAMAERLLRSEKLAGLGQLAGGVAHALNNPLTAVLGFAELIAETTTEARVREDATTIVREATRMRDTVQSLLDLWRPATVIDEAVDLTGLVRELSRACEEKLRDRGVRLVLEAAEESAAVVRGSRDRLRQVLEHLLNNAAQAISATASGLDAKGHAIRLTVRQDEREVQVIVSDTGVGFAEAARVFDPFYTTQHVEQGAGLGLRICYGIVREHGGEMSAFNLHPRGAAVVVELPVGKAVRAERRVLVAEGQR